MNQRKQDEVVKLPTNELIIEKQFSILEALVKLYRRNKRPISSKDLKGIHSDQTRVGMTLPFYSTINWLEEPTRYEYIPTDDLIQFFVGPDKKSAINNLAQKIEISTIGEKMFFYLSQRKTSVTKEDIINYLGAQFKLIESDKPKIERFIEILLRLGTLKISDDLVFLDLDMKNEVISESKEKPNDPIIENDVEKSEKIGEIDISKFNITLSILINPETDEEKIRRTIRIILEELNSVSE